MEIYKQKDQRYLFLIGFRSDRLGSSVGRLQALVSKRSESRRSFPAVRANVGLIHLGSSFFFLNPFFAEVRYWQHSKLYILSTL